MINPLSAVPSLIYSQFIFKAQLPKETFAGKTIIVTGANAGLGEAACRHFITLNCTRLIMAVRTPAKGEIARKAMLESVGGRTNTDVQVWPLDLGSFASVKAFAKRATEELDRVDVLVENAGIFQNTRWDVTKDGWEAALQTNLLSSALLAVLLMPKFRETTSKFQAQTRVVVLCSELHMFAEFPEKSSARILESLNDKTKPESLGDRYQTTKLLEILFFRELCSHVTRSSKEPINPIINIPNPGLNDNAVWQGQPTAHISKALFTLFVRFVSRPVAQGAMIIVSAAAAGEESHGSYLSDQVVMEPSAFVGSDQGAKVARKVFVEVMDVLEQHVPACRSLLQDNNKYV